jgi:hypothetical protein
MRIKHAKVAPVGLAGQIWPISNTPWDSDSVVAAEGKGGPDGGNEWILLADGILPNCPQLEARYTRRVEQTCHIT